MPRMRTGHKKSRNGCQRCKARRVKCDEKRPCTNCARHEVRCSLLLSDIPIEDKNESYSNASKNLAYSINTPLASAVGEANDGSPSSGLDITSHGLSPGITHRTASYPLINESHAYSPSEWMRSLRLLHHYCSKVYLTLSRDAATAEMWKDVVPEIACDNESLMHGLLAVSALHYAHIHPEQKREYQIQSAMYQDLALQDFSSRLDRITENDCEALFLLASLVFILSMRAISCPQSGDKPLGPGDIAGLFKLLLGVQSILDFRPLERWRDSGPLAPLLTPYAQATVVHETSFQRRMDKLLVLARDLPIAFGVINPQSACVLAIESLRNTHAVTASDKSPAASRRMWIWVINLPRLFIEMLGDSHPLALVIVAHYAALARPYEHKNWALQGWSLSVITTIEHSLYDQSHMLDWISWPKRSIDSEIEVDDMETDIGA